MDTLIPPYLDVEDYQTKLWTNISNQRIEKKFVDVKFVGIGGKSTWAHKAILSMSGTKFWKNLILDNSNPENDEIILVIIMPNEDILTITDWLDKIYNKTKPTTSFKMQQKNNIKTNTITNNTVKNQRKLRQTPHHKINEKSNDHIEEKKHCPICSRTFEKVKTYYSHMLQHQPEKWKFKCDLCPTFSTFQTARHLMLHKSKKHQEGIICSICGNTYSSDSNLKYHILNVHQASKFTCDECKKIFASKTYLKSHMKLHSKSQKLRKCPRCEKNIKGRVNGSSTRNLVKSNKAIFS